VWREPCQEFGPDYSLELKEEAWGRAKVYRLSFGEAANPRVDPTTFCPTAPVTDVGLNGAGTPRIKKKAIHVLQLQLHLIPAMLSKYLTSQSNISRKQLTFFTVGEQLV
jgi:hypothetical protein